MNIRDIRQMSQLTQADFAKRYHIPLQTIKQWESSPNSSSFRRCPEYVLFLLQKLSERELTDSMAAALDKHYKKKKQSDLLYQSESTWG